MTSNDIAVRTRQFSAVFFFVFVVLLLISKDSYMHDLPNHNDSAWFFMCGKAWMNGMTPYTDFTDSKGPLLWLVYGIGYLLAPHSYVGVFWLSCIAWTFTLLLAWRGAVMLLKNENTSFAAMLVPALAGLCPIVHNETRCEDFAMPFVAFVTYALCRAMSGDKWKWQTDFMLGASMSATLLMKYNITVMLLPLVLLTWVVAQKRCHACISHSVVSALSGVLAVMMPFAVYFTLKGCLTDFFNEYLLVTLHTTGNTGIAANTLHSLTSLSGIYAMAMFALSAVCLAKQLPCCRKMSVACNVWFFVVCAVNSRFYYFDIYSPFTLFIATAAVMRIKALQRPRIVLCCTFGTAVFLIASNLWVHDLRHADYGDFFTQDNAARHEFYEMECLVAQVPHAKMVAVAGVGTGICSGALPACKYWATQWGCTNDMLRQQIGACLNGKADFAVVPSAIPEIIHELTEAGWHARDFSDGPYKYVLMSKHRLGKRRHCCRVSNMDVLTKRLPRFCNSHASEKEITAK